MNILNIFTGATESQLNKVADQDKVEKAYIDFLRANSHLSIHPYEKKYKQLNTQKPLE